MSTHNIPFFNMKLRNTSKVIPNLQLWDFSKGFMNEFERAVVNEPSVFEPLKFYCTLMSEHLFVSQIMCLSIRIEKKYRPIIL